MSNPKPDDPHNFQEDYHLENGNYQNFCHTCGVVFLGYKRRTHCKICATKWKANFDALTQAQKDSLIKNLSGADHSMFKDDIM